MHVDEAVEILQRTPGLLEALLSGLSEPWLIQNEGPDTFSPVDVLGHLIHGEKTDWIPRLRIILEHGESRPFVPFDRFAFRTACAGMSTPQLLKTFSDLRQESLRVLVGLRLGPTELARTGTHPALGRVTLSQLLAAWVVHDLGHVKQIVRTMAKRYQDDVGPWREYLSILNRP